MKKQLQKFFAKKKNNKGFTLIELIIVIAILAILVGIVGFQATKYIAKSRVSADLTTMETVETATKTAVADTDNPVILPVEVNVSKANGLEATANGDSDAQTKILANLQKEAKEITLKSTDNTLTFTIDESGKLEEKWTVSSSGAIELKK